MSRAEEWLADYLAVRRACGYALKTVERLLVQFVGQLPGAREGQPLFTQDDALTWASLPGGADSWHAKRLSAVRGFAKHLRDRGLAVEVPGPRLLPNRPARAVPYLYSPAQLADLLGCCQRLFTEHRAATMRTLIGLLAVTGMRVGEALNLNIDEVDFKTGAITVLGAKGGKDRLLFLHDSSLKALAAHLKDPARPRHGDPMPFFTGATGQRLLYASAQNAFHHMAQACELEKQPGARPRLHDLRHTFATRTLAASYQHGSPITPARALTLLTTWLGHTDPAGAYWYLHASPELAAIAAARLEPTPIKTEATR